MSPFFPTYRRATTERGGGGVGSTRSMTDASPGPGEIIWSRSVASRSMRAGERSVSISSLR
jgi:hypothetical protein